MRYINNTIILILITISLSINASAIGYFGNDINIGPGTITAGYLNIANPPWGSGGGASNNTPCDYLVRGDSATGTTFKVLDCTNGTTLLTTTDSDALTTQINTLMSQAGTAPKAFSFTGIVRVGKLILTSNKQLNNFGYIVRKNGLNDDLIYMNGVSRIFIRGGIWNGNIAQNTAGSMFHQYGGGTMQIYISDMYIYNVNDNCLRLEASGGMNHYTNIGCTDIGGDGIYMTSTNDNFFTNIDIGRAGGNGINLSSANANTFFNLIIWNSGKDGLRQELSYYNSISNIRTDNNNLNGINIINSWENNYNNIMSYSNSKASLGTYRGISVDTTSGENTFSNWRTFDFTTPGQISTFDFGAQYLNNFWSHMSAKKFTLYDTSGSIRCMAITSSNTVQITAGVCDTGLP